jgi:putative transposase
MVQPPRKRSGHLFPGRYKAILVERDSYFLELVNSIRAAMVKHPHLWAWSSYGATMGTSSVPVWLTSDGLLAEFGNRRATARQVPTIYRGGDGRREHLERSQGADLFGR